MRKIRRSMIVIATTFIVVGVLIPWIIPPNTSAGAYRGLMFFRATEDESVYKTNPAYIERVTLPIRGLEVVYIERNPLLVIPLEAIKSILVSKERIPRNSQEREEIIQEQLGESPRKPPPKDASPEYYYFRATFLLREDGAKKLEAFSRQHVNDLLAVNLESRRFAVVTIPQPIDGRKFLVDLYEKDPKELAKVFSAVKSKVTWQ